LLALLGTLPQWHATGGAGQRRIDQAFDAIRAEARASARVEREAADAKLSELAEKQHEDLATPGIRNC
jgi:hypothetical protein